ncbi:MAG: beta-aspartyl-peptidase [Deltaproteobacteria bacterium]|nr:beta-aspartyl-peptidase [Deltaproteobacteria bacterium]
MRLELRILNIKDVRLNGKTGIKNNILQIDHQELKELLQKDKRFESVDIALARPGENSRILQVADVIEPRAKIDSLVEDFPGALGKQGIAGEGSTCVLRNVAVIINDQSQLCLKGPYLPGKILDMSGPAAEFSIYSKKQIVAVLPKPSDSVNRNDYLLALKIAGLKTSVYLASAGKELVPDEKEVYELPPLTETSKGMEGLPKVAYIFQVYMNQLEKIRGEPIFYGDSIRSLFPTIIHPNEVFDGAIVDAFKGGAGETYAVQNHSVIKELYSRHGKDLCFCGVVLTVSHSTDQEIERSGVMAAKLVKSVLGADGVILTKAWGGAPEIDMGQAAAKCEELGVKTALLMWNMTPAGAGGILFNYPKVNAITATANLAKPLKFPAMGKIIGIPGILPTGESINDEFRRSKWDILGIPDNLGHSNFVSVEY